MSTSLSSSQFKNPNTDRILRKGLGVLETYAYMTTVTGS